MSRCCARDRGRLADCRAPAERVPARRGGAGRHRLPDRPAHDRARRSASTGRRATASTPCRTATSRSSSCPPAPICATHLSRLAEEIVIWSNAPYRLRPAERRLHHRLLHHAAEAQPGCGRAGARQDRPHDRRAGRPADGDEGPAADLCQGHAGGQGSRLRRRREPGPVARRHRRHGARHDSPTSARMRGGRRRRASPPRPTSRTGWCAC